MDYLSSVKSVITYEVLLKSALTAKAIIYIARIDNRLIAVTKVSETMNDIVQLASNGTPYYLSVINRNKYLLQIYKCKNENLK